MDISVTAFEGARIILDVKLHASRLDFDSECKDTIGPLALCKKDILKR